MIEKVEDMARKGRGAISNDSGRYEAEQRVAVHDGWERAAQDGSSKAGPDGTRGRPAADPLDELAASPAEAQVDSASDKTLEAAFETAIETAIETIVIADSSKTILAKNDSPDIPFDRSINPYRGCEHGCIYCFARPSHAWLGFSPGLDFETRILAKHGAADLLRTALGRRGYKPAVIALGANTDPYQPIERRLGITRQVLEVLAEARHPVCIVTKSHLVTRDLDLLSDLAKDRLVRVIVSVTTLSSDLARVMEPRASTPKKRLQAITRLARAGVPAGVLSAPMIPAINDHEMEAILEASAEAGAVTAGYTLLRLPLEIKQLFEEWLDVHFPDRKDKVLNLVRETRGGKLYDPTFGRRLKGSGTYAELLSSRFKAACKRYDLNRGDWALATELFRPPRVDRRQLTLF